MSKKGKPSKKAAAKPTAPRARKAAPLGAEAVPLPVVPPVAKPTATAPTRGDFATAAFAGLRQRLGGTVAGNAKASAARALEIEAALQTLSADFRRLVG